jgi:hypothetical protein
VRPAAVALLASLLPFAASAQAAAAQETGGPSARTFSEQRRLFLELANVTQYYNFEFFRIPNYHGRTLLADTLRPTLTVEWDERFHFQAGVIAERLYGNSKGFTKVDPWLQVAWKPAPAWHLRLGNLRTPHRYLAPLFFETNYIEERTVETGLQLTLTQPTLQDDLHFNYVRQDTVDHPERFDWGFVHHNDWRRLHADYQAHWIHEGGQLHPHPINIVNDVAQAAGVGVDAPLGDWTLGANAYFLLSHERQEAEVSTDTFQRNGDARYVEGFVGYRQVRFATAYWRSFGFSHREGHPVYSNVGEMTILKLRWDVLRAREFHLFAEYIGYLLGEDALAAGRKVQSEMQVQADWQFSIPILEWSE